MKRRKYLYLHHERIKLAAKYLSNKLDGLIKEYEQMLPSIDSVTKDVEQLSACVDKITENLSQHNIDETRNIEDAAGFEKLTSNLQESQKIVTDATQVIESHARNTGEISSSLRQFDIIVLQLNEYEKKIAKLKDESKSYTRQEKLRERDSAAEKIADESPESASEKCDENHRCLLKKVKVEDKSSRNILVDLEEFQQKTKDDEKKDVEIPKELYVISGEKEGYDQEITITAIGQCKSGNVCPTVSLKGQDVDKEEVEVIRKTRIKSARTATPDFGWSSFMYNFIIPNMNQITQPTEYLVKAHECKNRDKVPDLKVISYPPAGWSGSVNLGYARKSEEECESIKEHNKGRGFLNALPMGMLFCRGVLEGYLDNDDFMYNPPNKFFKHIQECLNKIAPIFGEIENEAKNKIADFSIGWPNIEFGGGVDLAENPIAHLLGYDGEIYLKADPFIRVNMDVDIKALIIRILGTHQVFSDFLLEVLKSVEKGVDTKYLAGSTKLQIKLKTNVGIAGILGWRRKTTAKNWLVNAANSSFGGAMVFDLMGLVHVEGKLFCVQAAASAALYLRSIKDSTKGSKLYAFWHAAEGVGNPILKQQMSFSGLAIFYSAFFDLGIDQTEAGGEARELVHELEDSNESDGQRTRERRGGYGDENQASKQKEMIDLHKAAHLRKPKKLCLIFDSWKGIDNETVVGEDEVTL